ncbi:hypothetical protein CC78DRAFT_597193 [Lojkania enalia]|uniref:TUG ubiquitin-like domain-containing protein n=1 Tax=Lojkania enalia TaxID=147567 RepID=A0A9P4N7F1_9PLEO|nr:hypothetical protein CC78DRAFT_597193 [Didymosphaeria enalia]
MTSHVTIYNASARSFRIATSPGTYLSEVRDEACKKFNVSPDQFTLKYNNKPISLSQQIRLANLAQGARLELVQASRSPTVISVALQLPATEKSIRLTQKFASNTSLWEILRYFESSEGTNYNFTQRGVPEMSGTSGAGRLNYEMPVVTVMPGHREQSSFVDLQQTLSKLGFDSGSALLRLSFKNSGKPLEEAMAEISQYFKDQSTSIPNPATTGSEASESVAGEPAKKKASELEPMDVDSKPSATKAESTPVPNTSKLGPIATQTENTPPGAASPPVSSPPSTGGLDRNVQIFSAPTSSTPQAARNTFNANDYVPTIEHAKAHQAALQSQTRNQRLLSDKELEAEEAALQEKLKAAAEKGGSLRIRMPDQTMIQMDITKSDTAQVLYDFVEQFLEYKEPFQLKYVGAKGQQVLIPRSQSRLIQDLRFSGREVVTFIWDEKASSEARLSRKTLSREWADKAQRLEVREPVAEEERQEQGQMVGKSEGKKKAGGGDEDKESKLKKILGKGLFKR